MKPHRGRALAKSVFIKIPLFYRFILYLCTKLPDDTKAMVTKAMKVEGLRL